MSRHHPYGGYDGPPRRGSGPHGPGPERTFRFERGGGRGGRGRGGGPPSRGGYNNFGAHSGPSPSPSPGYDGYGSGAPPYPGGGGGGGGDQFYNDYGPPPDNYDGYEDGPGRGPPPPRRRREREDQVHDSLIEQRIQRERPCRTLFIRNIKYETDSNHVRARFEEFGEIKSFYDLISSRGMVFVTYYDLRAAERTRERLQGAELAGRPIDVHYSLPRADEQNGRCDRDKNQGTLLVSLRNSPSGQPIDEHELRRKLQQFGDVKGIKSAGSPTDRYVEMYDTRSCEEAHDKLRHQPLQDGDMEIEFAWDIPDQPLPPGPIPRRHDTPPRDDFRGRGGRGRGGPGRGGRGRGGGFGGDRDFRDDMDPRGRDGWDSRDHDRRDMDPYNRDREPPPRPHHGGYNSGPPPPMPPQNYPMYPSSAPPPPPPQDDRLEQAKKVQQLLEALKGPGAAGAAPVPPTPAQAPAPVAPRQHMPPPPPAAGNPYYPPPPQAASYPSAPSYSQPAAAQYAGYTAPPPIPAPGPAPTQAPPPPAQSVAPTLPPNIMALLQAQQQVPTPPPAQMPQYPAAMNHTGYPPPTPAAMAPPVPANSASQVQQLMALLQKRA
ncbi:hypothetical protein AURDEDRAFT_141332 [Auricularia subglabra TFB-10046 SS5]|nr:hypothetical protein AURDEDRAFT_141332 [Auricularia subglabra TFB-10046 SS5]